MVKLVLFFQKNFLQGLFIQACHINEKNLHHFLNSNITNPWVKNFYKCLVNPKCERCTCFSLFPGVTHHLGVKEKLRGLPNTKVLGRSSTSLEHQLCLLTQNIGAGLNKAVLTQCLIRVLFKVQCLNMGFFRLLQRRDPKSATYNIHLWGYICHKSPLWSGEQAPCGVLKRIC